MKKLIVTCLSFAITFLNILNCHAIEVADIDIHGFISQGYMQTDNNNYLAGNTEKGSFEFNEFGINFGKELTEKLRLGLQLFARDLGDIGNGEVTLDWAYGDYRWKDWLGFRAGKIKLPYGFYNETRDIDALRTNILLPQSVYNDLQRDTLVAIQGAGIYGEIPVGVFGDLSYQLQIGTFDVDSDSGIAKVTEALGRGVFEVEKFNIDTAYDGSLQWSTPLDGLRVGGSYLTLSLDSDIRTNYPFGPLPAGSSLVADFNDITNYVASAEYTWNDLVLAAEYTRQELTFGIDNVLPEDTTKSEGYYLSASYRFTDWLQVGTYYSVYYANIEDKDGDTLEAQGLPDHGAWQKDWALTTRFDLNEYWTIKLEGHMLDGTAQVVSIDNPKGTDEDWFMYAAKITFSF
jgi:hypothetical protein